MFDLPPAMIQEELPKKPAEYIFKKDLPGNTIDQSAKELKQLFSDGFQWSDLGPLMHFSIQILDRFIDLSLQEKRETVIQILNRFIDITDTPYLPDRYTDPLFKAIVPSFVYILLPDGFYSPLKLPESLNEKSLKNYTEEIKDLFKDGFQWKDLAYVLQAAIHFSNHFIQLNIDEKIKIAKKITDDIIDSTDTPYLPDSFIDPIFKALSSSLIQQFFSN